MHDILNPIKMLRSEHDKFNDKEISDKDMKTIINCSMKAANASNVQRYSMILLEDSNLIFEITGKRTAKKAIIYCLDYNRIIQTAVHMNHPYHACTDNWYDIISGIFDVSALAQTAVITASALGIDTLITNGVLRQNQRYVKEKLKLPTKYCIAIMAVLFGYTDDPREEIKNRLPAEYIVHKNEYRQLNDKDYDSIVKEYDVIYPEYISEKYPHYLDYLFLDWFNPTEEKDSYKEDIKNILLEAGFYIN